jgi:hypothetical protein
MTGFDWEAIAKMAGAIGVGGTIAILLALGLAVLLATRGDKIINTILAHSRETKRINAEIERNRLLLDKRLERSQMTRNGKSKGRAGDAQ